MSESLFRDLQKKLHSEIDHPDAIAAVLILISRSETPEILFTRRAMNLRSHPGEICFPGGMREIQDQHLWATALRETEEEIGLPEREIQLLGNLPASRTKSGTWVVPFVGSFNSNHPLMPAIEELDSIFQVPILDFKMGLKIRDDHFEHLGSRYQFPVYQYREHEIWGFTAGVTEQLLKLIF